MVLMVGNTSVAEMNTSAGAKKIKGLEQRIATAVNKAVENEANTEGNRQALIRAKTYVDDAAKEAVKKLDNIKELLDEMEKRHVKLIDDKRKGLDKSIRTVIKQEVAKVGKGKR